jgi:signal transduction histidine kinase
VAALGKTITGRIALGIAALHVIVLPTLYLGLVYILEQNNEEMFLNSTRGYARFLADDLERLDDTSPNSEVVEILDTVVLSGVGLYARLEGEGSSSVSSLIDPQSAPVYIEDFAIGDHGDDVYFISMPVFRGGDMLQLKVGFDETPYIENNAVARRNGLLLVAVYLLALFVLLPMISRRIARPVRSLQIASRQIASGELTGQLTAETDLVEFVELAEDLEHMKNRLIGMNEKLQQEILDREEVETERRSLEQQLRHSQRLETVGTMAGGIAHEINNILLPIILYTEMAIEDIASDGAPTEDLARVLSAAKRAKALVGQVLTFSRKMSSDEHVPVDLGKVVRDSADLARASMPPAATIEIKIAPNCPSILGDSSLLDQLVLNLLTNAIQALTDAGGTVQVTLDVTEADSRLAAKYPALAGHELVRLTVKDSGHGMDRATRNRIFEPFFTTRPVGQGTGLGLSVVHGIVTDLNGAIEVESALESGSTFSVYFPAIEDQLQSGNNTNSS